MSTQPDDYQRIAAAIEWIRKHRKAQPDVAAMSAAAGLGSAHFTRLFRRWSGITPQRYLASLTIADARVALREQQSVEEAAWSSGLSGPGRLHDLFVRIDAVSPGEFKTFGDGLTLRYAFAASPFGEALLVRSDRGIVDLSLGVPVRRENMLATVRDHWPAACFREDPAIAGDIAALLGGESREPVDVVLAGTPFRHKVWQALLKIAPGQTMSYGALADQLGDPGAARAVGSAVGANRVAWLIPCHRVLRADGEPGGYRWGGAAKELALAWEHCQTLR